jgi:hypothetical protein
MFYSTDQKPSVAIFIGEPIPKPDRFLSRDNHCFWFRVEDRDTVQTNQLGSLVRVTEATGDSKHPNGNYNRKTPIKWSQPTISYVFCSKVQPTVIFENDESGSRRRYRPVTQRASTDTTSPTMPSTCLSATAWRKLTPTTRRLPPVSVIQLFSQKKLTSSSSKGQRIF